MFSVRQVDQVREGSVRGPGGAQPRRAAAGGELAQRPRQDALALLRVELETKVKRRFAKIRQSRRRPLLGPSPG